jgi:hypothetical protein
MATTLYRGDDQRALLANPADDAASSTEDDATDQLISKQKRFCSENDTGTPPSILEI